MKKIILIIGSILLGSCTSNNGSVSVDSSSMDSSPNSWTELNLVNYQDIPPEWKYYTIPGTPLEIPLPTTSVIVTNRPKLELFSLPEEDSGFKNWERDFVPLFS